MINVRSESNFSDSTDLEKPKKFPDTDLGRERVSSFFSLFYASINAGSLLSTFISPILREKVKCFDRDDCYFVAFLVPACLMAVAILGWFSKILGF